MCLTKILLFSKNELLLMESRILRMIYGRSTWTLVYELMCAGGFEYLKTFLRIFVNEEVCGIALVKLFVM